MRQPLNKYKYILTLVITIVIFGVIFYLNNLFEEQRIGSVKTIQDQISLDILSSETQFDLLKGASCKNIDGSILTQEINSLANKLSYFESTGDDKPSAEVTYLKKYYSLLQIKDYLLMQQVSDKCKTKPISLLYFYGQRTDCPDCEKMGYVLTYLRETYPQLRIYSFDANLNLSALNTLKSIYKITPDMLPAVVYEDETTVGFRSIDEMKELIPLLKQFDAASSTASSTSAASKATSTLK